MVPLAGAFTQLFARETALTVGRRRLKGLELCRSGWKHVAIGREEFAFFAVLLLIIVAEGMIENLYFNAIRQSLGMFPFMQVLDRFLAGPHEHARIAARLQMHPLHDELEVRDRLLHSHHARRRTRALNLALLERPCVRSAVDVDEIIFP